MFRATVTCLFLTSVVGAAASLAAPVQQSISTSRQFIVYGTELAVRGAICDFAERTKREVLTLLAQRDDWTTAIVINAQYPQANLPELPRLNVEFGQTGFGLKLQLDVVVSSEVNRPELRRELRRALLLEIMYRGQPKIPAGTAYRSPPDWLLDGIPAQPSELSRDRLLSILALPVAAKNVTPLEKFVAQRPELLDAAGRTLYRAYSFALVDLLSRAPDGSRRLRHFLSNLPFSSDDPMAALRNHFPDLFESEAAERIWEQEVARLSTEQPYRLLGSAETERLLAEKLRLRFPERGATKTLELEDFAAFLRLKAARTVLGALAHDLSELATRANPVYAPIIGEYAEITARLLRGKTAGIARRLERLRADRAAVTGQMRQIDDYLNWFEATNLAGPSGEFADYMRAADRASQRELPRRDPISVYLDALEAQFEN